MGGKHLPHRSSPITHYPSPITHHRFPLTIHHSLASPAMRFGLQDAEFLELSGDVGLALLGRGRQRRPGWPDRASHDDHPALERRGVLVAEQVPQPRELELEFARADALSGDACIVELR